MISGLASTDENYSVALYILKRRYANESKQTNVLMQRFHAMSTPKHNSKDLRVFLTEYRKIKHQLSRIVDLQANELVIKSVVVRKLPFQTFDRICDIYVTHDFTLEQMEAGIQHIVDKLEQAVLALAEGAVIKQVGVNSQSQNPPSRQSKSKANHRCSYCSGEHPAHESTKYKTVQSRKDRILKLRLCFSCLTPGHSSKMCHIPKLVGRVVHHITHPYVSRHVRIVLIIQIRVVMSVKGKRVNPLLVVVLTIVLKHKCSRTPLANPLLHIVNLVRVKLMHHPHLSIPHM